MAGEMFLFINKKYIEAARKRVYRGRKIRQDWKDGTWEEGEREKKRKKNKKSKHGYHQLPGDWVVAVVTTGGGGGSRGWLLGCFLSPVAAGLMLVPHRSSPVPY